MMLPPETEVTVSILREHAELVEAAQRAQVEERRAEAAARQAERRAGPLALGAVALRARLPGLVGLSVASSLERRSHGAPRLSRLGTKGNGAAAVASGRPRACPRRLIRRGSPGSIVAMTTISPTPHSRAVAISLSLSAALLAGCGPSIDPAAKADIDRRIAALSARRTPLPGADGVRADAARGRAVVAVQDGRRQGTAVVPHLQDRR